MVKLPPKPPKKKPQQPQKEVEPLPSGILSKHQFRSMEDGRERPCAPVKDKKAVRVSTRLTDKETNKKELTQALKSFKDVMLSIYTPFYGHLYPDKIHNKKMKTYLDRISLGVRGLQNIAVQLKTREDLTIESFRGYFHDDVPKYVEKLQLAINGLREEIEKHAH